MTRGRDLVNWGGRLVPRSLAEDIQIAGACVQCGGSGVLAEAVDTDQWPEMTPCWRCQMFCKRCQRWVAKEGHEHP